MTRRMNVTRVGPGTATLQRRVTVGNRAGSLFILVEVWGVNEARHRAAIEQRLAAGMAAIFEKHGGSATARLKRAVLAGDRWLRRVESSGARGSRSDGSEDGEEGPRGDRAAGERSRRPGRLGAGASLLYVDGEYALLAQAGPSVAFAVEPDVAPGDTAPTISSAAPPEAVRHPGASPWLRRGVEELKEDALWLPLGMGDPGRLEIHWARWPFPPGASALLAPSVSAGVLTREVVGPLLTQPHEMAKRQLDETLEGILPAIHIAHPAPPAAIGPLDDAPASEPDAALDLTRRFDAIPFETGPQPLPPEPGEVASGTASFAGGDGPPDASAATRIAESRAGYGASAGPDSDASARAAMDEAGAAALEESDSGGHASAQFPPRTPSTSLLDSLDQVSGIVLDKLRLGTIWLARGLATLLIGMLPRRGGSGADSLAAERTRLAAAGALTLPVAVLLLTGIIWLRAPAAGTLPDPMSAQAGEAGAAPVGPGSAAATLAAADPPEERILRLADIRPLANLPGKAEDPRRIALSEGQAFVLNTELDRVDRVDPAGDPITPETALVQGEASAGRAVAALDDLFWLPPPDDDASGRQNRGRVIALDQSGMLWAIDERPISALDRAASPAWSAVRNVAGFNGRLYALDRSTSQIYRYTAPGGLFPSFTLDGEAWLQIPADLSTARDLSINGSVFVLDGEGGISKFVNGSPAAFTPTGIPGDPPTPVAIFAGPLEGPLLVADRAGGRILALADDGAYQGQLLRPPMPLVIGPGREGEFGFLHDIHWDVAAEQLYIQDGNTLLRAGYSGGP